jgi:hypothetical protein
MALVGARAPDDRLYAHGIRRARFATPRWLRPGLMAASAALVGGAATLVHARGGWLWQEAALALSVSHVVVEAVWAWIFAGALWLRVAIIFKSISMCIALSALVESARATPLTLLLWLPVCIYGVHGLADTSLVLYYNSQRVENEVTTAFVNVLEADPVSSLEPQTSVTLKPARD